MSVDPNMFRAVSGRFATGVTVVTTHFDGLTHGMTANAFTTVSLEPTLVLVCVEKRARTHEYIPQSGAFAINILAEDQEHLSRFFAGPHNQYRDELDGIPYRLGETGSPIIAGTIGYLDCRLTDSFPGGDHTIYLAEVVDLDFVPTGRPLLFFGGKYHGLSGEEFPTPLVRPLAG